MPDLPAAPSPANDGGGEINLAPSPNGGGGGNQQSPTFPWPSRPRQVATPESSPVTVTDKGGAMPFINSNPAVPLPTGEVDSATLRPSITSGLQQVPSSLSLSSFICDFSQNSIIVSSFTPRVP